MKAKHFLVNGASSGIGAALVKLLCEQGHKVSVCGQNKDKLLAVTASLPSNLIVHSDNFCVSDHEKISVFCHSANNKLAVDVLVNCVGINQSRSPALGISKESLDWHMQINCYAPIAFINQLAPSMKASDHGLILNVLSTVCLYANPNIAAYTASKSAFDSFSKVLRKELRADNIKVLSIYPGGVNTDFREADRPNYLSAIDVAESMMNMIFTSDKVNIHELVIRPKVEENF